MNTGKALHKIHGDIGPDLGGNFQRLKEAGGVQMLRFVALASETRTDKFFDKAAVMVDHKLPTETMEGLFLSLHDPRRGLTGGPRARVQTLLE